jgi:hypothetical protein
LAAPVLLGQGYQQQHIPVSTAGSTAYTDDFDRADEANVSTDAPDPPGTYTETEAGSCTTSILSNQLRFNVTHATSCDSTEWGVIGDYEVGSVDHCVLFQYQGNTGWPATRGPRVILRAETTSTPGMHYQNRCTTPDCQAAKWIRVDGTTLQEAITADTDCDGEIPTMNTGDYFGSCVTGTGDGTTQFRTWVLTSAPSDPEDASTWGTADCDTTPSGFTPDDSGELGGITLLCASGCSNGDSFDFNNLSVTSTTP